MKIFGGGVMRINPVNDVNTHSVPQQKTAQAEIHIKNRENYDKTNIETVLDGIEKSLEKIRSFLKAEAQFTIDRDLNMIIIKIKNTETGEIIRQIPPEVAVKIAKNLQELIGILFDERA